MSLGLIEDNTLSVVPALYLFPDPNELPEDTGIPSMIINGSFPAPVEAAPRMRKVDPPPTCALLCVTCRPAAFPASAWLTVE